MPANIDIYRTRISQNIPKTSPSIASSATTSLAPLASAASLKAIYGSVSTSDIAEDIKTILQEDEEGSRVVLSAADITFVAQAEESDRVKHVSDDFLQFRMCFWPLVKRGALSPVSLFTLLTDIAVGCI